MAITSLEGFLLTPIFLGQAARVNSVAVFVSIMFWGWMWGMPGMLLAVPILMIVKTWPITSSRYQRSASSWRAMNCGVHCTLNAGGFEWKQPT